MIIVKIFRLRKKIENLKEEFYNVFCKENEVIEYCELEKCKIETAPGEIVLKRRQMIPQYLIKRTEEHLDCLERRKIIRRSNSQWRNPIRSLPKPDGGIRLVRNLMALNYLVKKDLYNIASIRDVIRATQGSGLFTVIDLKEKLYHIKIGVRINIKLHLNQKEWLRWNSMVMGFKNSPQILQMVIDSIFEDLRNKGVKIYMDDIVVLGKTENEHDKLVLEVLKRLEENKMRVSIKKMQFKLQKR